MIKKTIGILGGMGPEASGYLYKLLIDLSVKYFNAKHNDDFPEVIIHSVPVPDFISSDRKRGEALQMLSKRAQQLNKLDISCLSIACNTAHVLLNDLQKNSDAPFVSMIDEVVQAVKDNNHKVVGLLGTPSTIRYQLYQKALEADEILTIIPNDMQIKTLGKVIRNVLAGKILKQDTQMLTNITDTLKEKGVEGIILGCTELPLVFPLRYSLPVYNSVEILALALLRRYYK